MGNLAEHKDKIDTARHKIITALLLADQYFDTLLEELNFDQKEQYKMVDYLVDYCYGNIDPDESTEYSSIIRHKLFGTPL